MRTWIRTARECEVGGIVAAQLSVAAGTIHLVVIPEHFREWWGYGVFFMSVAIAQVLYSVVLLLRPGPVLYLAGIVGTLLLIALWSWTRVVGVPFLGPGAGEREAVGFPDAVSKIVELALIVVLAALLHAAVTPRHADGISGPQAA